MITPTHSACIQNFVC